jgi:hypothetical protein
MRGSSFKPELAAAAIVAAMYQSDKEACEHFGISQRSLQNYRQKLATDLEFAALFAKKKAEFDNQWADELPGAIRESLLFLHEAARAAREDPAYRKNPIVIQAVAGAMKLCAEVYYTGKIIDARLAEQSRTPDQISEQVSPTSEALIEYPN